MLCRTAEELRIAACVNVNEEWELRYWTKEFGVSEERLRKTVEKVGPSVEPVLNALRAAYHTATAPMQSAASSIAPLHLSAVGQFPTELRSGRHP